MLDNKREIEDISQEKTISKGSIQILDGFSFYKFIEALSNITDEIPLIFDPVNKVLNIMFMDVLRLCIMNIEINTDINTDTTDLKNLLKVKKEINVEINGSITGKKVYISLDDLEKLLKIKKHINKTIKLIFGDREELVIEKIGFNNIGTVKKSLMYLDLNFDEISMNTLESVDYPNNVSISTKLLIDMFYESNNYSDVCTIKTNKKGIYFKEIGVIGKYEASYLCKNLESCCCDGSEIGSYAYSFLNVIENFLRIMGKDDIIKFYQKTDHPLKVVIVLKRINTTITYYIASRVNEEDFVDNKEEDI